MSQPVQLRGKHTAQTAHCALLLLRKIFPSLQNHPKSQKSSLIAEVWHVLHIRYQVTKAKDITPPI